MAAAQAPIAIWQQAESSAHLLFCQELQELTRIHPLAEYHRLTDGSLSARIEQRYVHGDAQRQREFFICGVGEVVTRLRDRLRGAGYERRAVHYERW
jgi:ferredoxin-NADP reductase